MKDSYIKEDGNIVINYNKKKYKDKKKHFILLGIALLGVFIWSCYLFSDNPTNILLFFLFLGFFPLFIVSALILSSVNKANEKIERNIILQNLNNIINRDINTFGNEVYELERKYVRFHNGNKTERTVFVLLSNGKELLYSISDIAGYEKVAVLEINTKYKIKNQIN